MSDLAPTSLLPKHGDRTCRITNNVPGFYQAQATLTIVNGTRSHLILTGEECGADSIVTAAAGADASVNAIWEQLRSEWPGAY